MSERADRTPSTTRDVALDVGLGVGAALWYALPDVVPSRLLRGLVKTVAVAGAAGIVVARAGDEPTPATEPGRMAGRVGPVATPWSTNGAGPRVVGPGGAAVPGPIGPDQVPRGAVAMVAFTSALSLLSTVGMDRAMAWGSRRLRARGVRRPHAAMGVGVGITTALSRPSRRLR